MKRESGQAMVELAIFGSLMLLVFGLLLSYTQRLNDQQYIQMEAFRRAEQKACLGAVGFEQSLGNDLIDFIRNIPNLIASFINDPLGTLMPGKGAAVQYTVVQHRRYVDLSPEYRKGNPQMISGSAAVYWANPYVGTAPESLMSFKINDDAPITKNVNGPNSILSTLFGGSMAPGGFSLTMSASDIQSEIESSYTENTKKIELGKRIINQRQSSIKDNITTTVKFKIDLTNEGIEDWLQVIGFESINPVSLELPGIKVTQGIYRGLDGKYHYSSLAKDNTVTQEKLWTTDAD